jgi:hypothetical protein
MDLCNSTTQCCPAPLIQSERDHFLIGRHQMRAKYRTDTCGVTGALKFDRSIDAVGVGAGERAESALRCCLSQQLRTRCAETEREVSVGVEMGEHE